MRWKKGMVDLRRGLRLGLGLRLVKVKIRFKGRVNVGVRGKVCVE